MAIRDGFKDFLRTLGFETLAQIVAEEFRKVLGEIGKKGAEEAVKRLISMIDEKRAEMFAYINTEVRANGDRIGRRGKRLENAADAIMRRHRARASRAIAPNGQPYDRFAENRMVALLTKLYLALNEPHELARRKTVFVELGHMSDEEFDYALEFLYHDILRQLFGAAGDVLKKAWESGFSLLRRIDGGMAQWAAGIFQAAERLNENTRRYHERMDALEADPRRNPFRRL